MLWFKLLPPRDQYCIGCLSIFLGLTLALIRSVHSCLLVTFTRPSLLSAYTPIIDFFSFLWTLWASCFCRTVQLPPNGQQPMLLSGLFSPPGWTERAPKYRYRPAGQLGDEIPHICSKWHRIKALKWFYVNSMLHSPLLKEHLQFRRGHPAWLGHWQIAFIWPSPVAALHVPT